MFRKDGYVRLSRAPVALSFRTLSLLTDIEHVDVYDGASANARMIARYTGRQVPHQITSTGAELRLVYWVDLNRTAFQAWEEIEAALKEEAALAAGEDAFLEPVVEEPPGGEFLVAYGDDRKLRLGLVP